jgi:hypothetical protein
MPGRRRIGLTISASTSKESELTAANIGSGQSATDGQRAQPIFLTVVRPPGAG